MKLNDLMGSIYQYGGTIVMAGLFIYVFIQDRIKANKLQEDNNSMLKLLTESNKTLTESNNNIAKSLDIISNNLVIIDNKIDRNYEIVLRNK